MKALIVALIVMLSCSSTEPFTEFPPQALKQEVLDISGNTITIKEVLEKYQGKTVVIDVWASWCKDCIKGMPKVKALQANEAAKDAVFVFLSMDKSKEAWLNGMARFGVTGENYFMGNDWKNDFNTAIGLDWIPRYMVVGKDGNVKVFKAIKADDEAILKAIKEDN